MLLCKDLLITICSCTNYLVLKLTPMRLNHEVTIIMFPHAPKHIHTIIFMCADINHSLRYESKALCEAKTQLKKKSCPGWYLNP